MYERSLVGLRLKGGRVRNAEKGRYAYGSPPFGWRAEAGALVEVPKEQAALALIRERHAAGDSLRHAPRRGTRRHPGVLRRIVARR